MAHKHSTQKNSPVRDNSLFEKSTINPYSYNFLKFVEERKKHDLSGLSSPVNIPLALDFNQNNSFINQPRDLTERNRNADMGIRNRKMVNSSTEMRIRSIINVASIEKNFLKNHF